MDTLKILLVEDSIGQQKVFRDTVEVFNDKNNELLVVEYEISSNLDEALKKLDGSFDGTILDLKLNQDEDGGNKIVNQLNESLLRVPVIFVTGYPDLVNDHPIIVKKRARGSETYAEDLEVIRDIKNTGLTNIMGGRGIIERTLNHVFLHNLLPLPQRDTWISYGKTDSSRTEKALLRHTLNHLLQLLDENGDLCFPEEFYICPPLTQGIKTGSIVKRKDGGPFFMILNPACDLVIRANGQCKTDHILLLEIEPDKTTINAVLEGVTKKDKKHKKLEAVLGNNYTDYYHWLPRTDYFEGGFLNFRKLSTLNKDDFLVVFNKPSLQISQSFVKDIVSRFSSYYARQGQPDIELKDTINKIVSPGEDKAS